MTGEEQAYRETTGDDLPLRAAGLKDATASEPPSREEWQWFWGIVEEMRWKDRSIDAAERITIGKQIKRRLRTEEKTRLEAIADLAYLMLQGAADQVPTIDETTADETTVDETTDVEEDIYRPEPGWLHRGNEGMHATFDTMGRGRESFLTTLREPDRLARRTEENDWREGFHWVFPGALLQFDDRSVAPVGTND
jgi:hypothetical protein